MNDSCGTCAASTSGERCNKCGGALCAACSARSEQRGRCPACAGMRPEPPEDFGGIKRSGPAGVSGPGPRGRQAR